MWCNRVSDYSQLVYDIIKYMTISDWCDMSEYVTIVK